MTDSPFRVLFVIPGDGRGSSMIFARREAENLSSDGVEAACFYLSSRTSPFALIREFFRLRTWIRTLRPHLLHAQFGTVTAALAAMAAGKRPLVITYRGGDLNPASHCSPRAVLGHWLSQLAAIRAVRIVCVSRELCDRLWWRRSRVSILPSAVDPDLFRPEPRQLARLRLNWNPDQPVVLFNAGYDPRNKRLDLAEQSIAVAQRSLNPLRLEVLLGGTDPSLIPSYMNSSDCLLIASDSEGSPTVLAEALACGLPIVSVDAGDAAERLRGVHPSRLVPRDPEVIGRALADIAASARRSNGPAAIQSCTLSGHAQVLARLYREALNAK